MQTLLTGLAMEHVIMPIVSLIITALVGWAVQRFHAWTGYQIEARHREALQSALENGVRFAIQRLAADRAGFDPLQMSGQDKQKVLDGAVDYVLGSVPDAVRHFGLGRNADLIERLALPKLPIPTLTEAEARAAAGWQGEIERR